MGSRARVFTRRQYGLSWPTRISPSALHVFLAERPEAKDSERLSVSQIAETESQGERMLSIIMKIFISFWCSFSYYLYDIYKYI